MERICVTRRLAHALALLITGFALAGVVQVSVAGERPNVILVMADDLGIGDITPTSRDCKIKTPNLQEMASEGITFFDAHTPSSVCSPTRYGLLTGRYNWRSRLARGVLSGRSSHLIPADRPTLGHLMRKAGYHTAMLGKWHLGWDWHKKDKRIDFTQPVKNGPDINGFDQYYAHCGSLDMPPYVWVDTGRVTAQPDREEGVTKKEDRYGWYRKGPIGSDFEMDQVLPHLFDKSIAYIKRRAAAAKTGRPFFLYLALPAPHTPIVPIPPFQGASQLNPYGDFVIEMDHYMGQLLATVKEAGLDDATLVIFTSDNGCSPEANFELLQGKGHDPSAGYRGHKADIYEGGHRVPLIVRWPGHIKGGRKTKALACLTDLYPTLEEIAGQPHQARGGEDGFSLLPVLKGADTSRRGTLISHSISGRFAIRQGAWKLCLCYGSGGWSAPQDNIAKKQGLPPLQLFNLEEDPGEQNNLVSKHPDKVAALLKLLDQQIQNGRCTPGEVLRNDRAIEFLPKGVVLPENAALQTRPDAKAKNVRPKPDRELVYKKTSQGDLKFDIFQPKDWRKTDRRGAIVFF
jgi:arylsulfatase A